jgi:hypothetical protein
LRIVAGSLAIRRPVCGGRPCRGSASDRRQHVAAQECMPGAVGAGRYFARNCGNKTPRWPSRKWAPIREAVRFLTHDHMYSRGRPKTLSRNTGGIRILSQWHSACI